MEYIALTFVVSQEGKYYVSECLELGTSSFGETEREAVDNLKDATTVFLYTLKDLGDDRKILREKGVKIYAYKPASLNVRKAQFPVDSTIRPIVLDLEKVSA